VTEAPTNTPLRDLLRLPPICPSAFCPRRYGLCHEEVGAMERLKELRDELEETRPARRIDLAKLDVFLADGQSRR
jgi:hypothetical protein